MKPWQVGGCLALVVAGLCLLTGLVQLPSQLCIRVMLPSLWCALLFWPVGAVLRRQPHVASLGWDVLWAAGIVVAGCFMFCAAQMISQPYDTRDSRHVDAMQIWAIVVCISLLFGRWRNTP